MCSGEQIVPQSGCFASAQVTELGAAVPGVEAQLSETEHSCRQWLDDVDRLKALKRDLRGFLEDPTGLDPQFLVVDHESGEIPGDEAGDSSQHYDDAANGKDHGKATRT